ncbi:hypothetical protein [Streptomyces sp. VRA16 Mangrove soil]|uniref:hypothetical protein n=1 Tax=Streptomyces sp. VRA16 Mangrove soil TaxID=2817434 RepID=UPI001A9FC9A4|nr:hypothetical protein [Streptomyces sp. VRA16 Mangrove soil]MBO1334827.1 hypothetical protein [Streptomyces sp. VRA16 Mangrove soil]
MIRRTPVRRAATALLLASALAVTGCSGHGKTTGKRHKSAARQGSSAAPTQREQQQRRQALPKTAAQFVARARRTMGDAHGWTFALHGTQALVMDGAAPNRATYDATAYRTMSPVAYRSEGGVLRKGARANERVYAVGGTGYGKQDGKAWKKGPLGDPDIADMIEDPVAELDTLAQYAKSAKVTGAGTRTGRVTLRVTASGWTFADARERPAFTTPVRETQAALRQLRANGVTATDRQVTVRSFEETWVLDAAHGYRLVSHQYAFTVAVPYQGRTITHTQEMRQETRGTYGGRVTLPSDAPAA